MGLLADDAIRESRIATRKLRGVGASPVAANELALSRSRTGCACRAEINEGGSRRSGCLGEVAAVTW
jgi:hypothetical protein